MGRHWHLPAKTAAVVAAGSGRHQLIDALRLVLCGAVATSTAGGIDAAQE
jgi:hypothetical protein